MLKVHVKKYTSVSNWKHKSFAKQQSRLEIWRKQNESNMDKKKLASTTYPLGVRIVFRIHKLFISNYILIRWLLLTTFDQLCQKHMNNI